MRLLLPVAIACLLVRAAVRADDPPEGSIGVQVKLDDGKIVVVEPIKGGPADKAGVKANDVIVKVNDFKAEDLEATVKEIVKQKPGDKVKLTVNRDGKDMVIEITVGKRSEVLPKK
jgi:carboxyl-terminal processing protease